MTTITADHLARSACVYVRQSTADQLVHNHESRRRQYGLVGCKANVARAKELMATPMPEPAGSFFGGFRKPAPGTAAQSFPVIVIGHSGRR
jgi:hypothetical protein